ncbi:MAG: carbon starvation CstA family protein [Peptoniphilaceae bacterium]|nr:carbon starvation protein A [Peptoniphilaceae bacterium]MDD7383428.1 carbon starvation CstA family protein [Peptoniphilaceae bacterium]MDY3738823.1 carbon starvation CstA family protein [Peptoniphilaceae bacterium]
MALFLVGVAILIVGGIFYSKIVDNTFQPDDRKTPAVEKADGIDYVAMPEWKNALIELLNIAGTGPILGPIQGILFGPIAFLAIPLGNIFAGSVHDYFNGMISMRNGGAQIPALVEKYLGKGIKRFYNVIVAILLLLTGVVFVYTPGDLIVGEILHLDVNNNIIWIIYAVIFIYYILSTVLPIDQIIGRIYPVFGLFLLISAIGVFIGILRFGSGHMTFEGQGLLAEHPLGQKFIPSFFITVACGILSGFHGSQSTLISRTVDNEKQGRSVFFGSMVVEGLIAMAWAGGAIVLFSQGQALDTSATLMVGQISRKFMGNIGGLLAIIGVIVLPITSGDTSFRALRLIIAEQMKIDQKDVKKRIGISLVIFIPAVLILYFAKTNPNGFNILWRYFGFTNQFVAIFALAVATSYLYHYKKAYLMTHIPGTFYCFIVMTFISISDIGLHLPSTVGYIIGVICAAIYFIAVPKISKSMGKKIDETILG